jgi:hypothetical protein
LTFVARGGIPSLILAFAWRRLCRRWGGSDEHEEEGQTHGGLGAI